MLFYIRTCVTYDYFSFNNKILDFTNLILHFDVSFNYFCHVKCYTSTWKMKQNSYGNRKMERWKRIVLSFVIKQFSLKNFSFFYSIKPIWNFWRNLMLLLLSEFKVKDKRSILPAYIHFHFHYFKNKKSKKQGMSA